MILDVNSDQHKTVNRMLPYKFKMLPSGKVSITNLRGQVLHVNRDEVNRMLAKKDLDGHRRAMYASALEVFQKNDPKPEVQ
jgi:hypothetical protein